MTALAGRAAAIESLRRLANEAIGYGVTTIQAMGNSLTAADLASELPEAATPNRWRVIRFPIDVDEKDDPGSYAGVPRAPSPLVTASGIKWILDGTPLERLAAMNEPYVDRAGWSGRLNLSSGDIEPILRRALSSTDQLMLHIVGDRGVDELLSTRERLAPAEQWARRRVRIEHGEFVSGDRVSRARRLAIVVVQKPAHFTLAKLMRERLGPRRADSIDTIRSLVADGVPFALGGDGPLNPYLNIMWAVTHEQQPAEALTREQAVAAYTTGSAYEFAEHDKGRIADGMLADVAVLTQDIFTVDVERLPATLSAVTIVNGRIVRNALQ